MTLDWGKVPHRRFNPLTGEWILVSPQRVNRPWQGETDAAPLVEAPRWDAGCYLCPGNRRAGGSQNPPYESTFVFDNDFPGLAPDSPEASLNTRGLLRAETERGICRVVCFSPRHDLAIPSMTVEAVTGVVGVWTEQYQALGDLPSINHVQIFENRGRAMGASNAHPHGQIWANATVPAEVARETLRQQEYAAREHSCLLCDYAALERGGERVVSENESFLTVVPFWAVWPFETLVLPRRHVSGIDEFASSERADFARALQQLTARYDRLFQTPFPYTMGIHQRPTDGRQHGSWHMHTHFYPPLLRSASVRKFMVGYELLAAPQRDLTPEAAARRLREEAREATPGA